MDRNRKLSVLHLISSSAFLGAERVVCELASSADPERIRMQVGILGSPPSVVDSFKAALEGSAAELIYFPCAGKISLSCIRKIQHHFKVGEVSVVHSHGYKSDLYAYLAAVLGGSRPMLVATNHTWKLRTFSERLYKLIDATILKSFRWVVAVSGEVRDEMISLGIDRSRTNVILNGASLNGYQLQKRSELRLEMAVADQHLLIGCVASLTKEKAQADLIRAFASVLQRAPGLRLVLVGDGPDHAELVALSEALAVRDRIVFAGQRQDVKSLYVSFDVFALVSHAEGLPMAMLEAMAASLPIVVSGVGAIPQVITAMKNGLVVAPGDVDAIADCFHRLAGDPALRAVLGANARSEVEANYSVKRMAGEYEKLYRDLLEQNP